MVGKQEKLGNFFLDMIEQVIPVCSTTKPRPPDYHYIQSGNATQNNFRGFIPCDQLYYNVYTSTCTLTCPCWYTLYCSCKCALNIGRILYYSNIKPSLKAAAIYKSICCVIDQMNQEIIFVTKGTLCYNTCVYMCTSIYTYCTHVLWLT